MDSTSLPRTDCFGEIARAGRPYSLEIFVASGSSMTRVAGTLRATRPTDDRHDVRWVSWIFSRAHRTITIAQLSAPPGARVDAAASARGRETFRTAGCTSCHNVDQSKPVPTSMLAMRTVFAGDNPVVLAQREPPLNPVVNTPDSIFDDKMAVVNASLRGEVRGLALPLLLDLERKPVFLHDNSVASLDELFDARRGAKAPHPFYISDRKNRADLVEFLKGLDTGNPVRR